MEFPSHYQILAALNKRLETGGTTLEELRGLEDEALLQYPADEKAQAVWASFFARIEDKRESLVNRVMKEVGQGEGLIPRMRALQSLLGHFEPEEAASALQAIEGAISLEADPETKQRASKCLETLEFTQNCPLLGELSENTIASNFMTRLKRVEQTLLEEHSLRAFHLLNETQRREISQYAQGDTE